MNPETALSSAVCLAFVAFAFYTVMQGLRRPKDIRPTDTAPTNTPVRVLLSPTQVSAGWRDRGGAWTVIRERQGRPVVMSAKAEEIRGWFPIW